METIATEEKDNLLDFMQKAREEKDLDTLQEVILHLFTVQGVKTDEVAALLFSIMKSVLNQPLNKELLKERLAIDIDTLGADGVLQVQHALMTAYLERIAE